MSTREHILRVAREMFSESGYYETTMSRLAERAGVGKGTLYWHFPSKQKLFREILKEGAERYLSRLEQLADKDEPAAGQLRAVAEFTLGFFRRNRRLAQMVVSAMAGSAKGEVTAIMKEWFLRHRRPAGDLMEKGMERGELAPGDSRLLAVAFMGMIQATARLRRERREGDEEELAGELVRLFLDGAGAGSERRKSCSKGEI